ncbi:ectoine/hydroxyectoine ABC transporter permease subunit EhuD [Nitriliruptor alkaliphilus]|uniref:ectoine/hydroxyectoine ABC transporter permease subunit EhuD n=1 Tax=Nitriliruptor alkaliphilus TaxID=427918 RepID=UPI000ACB8243|nr:ectoine/hydroxyectoine ABC transporter permease subunit EhuD [Nitriliruptor alkaliphilus]
MSAATTPTEGRSDRPEFQPHRRWYRRPDVAVPVALVTIGFAILVSAGDVTGRYQARFTAERDVVPDWEFLFHLIPQMLRGLYVTARATVLGFMIAVTLGFLMALARRSQVRAVSWPAVAIIEFIRSTPILVQLVFLQALTRATPVIALTGVQVLIIGLGVHYATYCSEGYRAGINSVAKGQWEASTALNLSPWTKWTKVIIPQAVPNTLPALGNYLIAGFKDAPIADAVVAVPGVLFFANTIRADSFRPVEPYLLIGVGFLLVSLPAAFLVRRLERRLAYERI